MKKFYNRELSWLSFNFRVLQEAINEEVPLLERLKFLAIYSSNLDEFYRVRVASYIHFLKVQKSQGLLKDTNTVRLLKKIKKKVQQQQMAFGIIFRKELLPRLREKGIFIIDNEEVNTEQNSYLQRYFNKEIKPHLKVRELKSAKGAFLKNKGLYLVYTVNEGEEKRHYIVNVPTNRTDRFIVIPNKMGKQIIIQLSDVMRLFVPGMFPNMTLSSFYMIKLTRDAELYLEDEVADTIQDKVAASLHKRNIGAPTRLLYDESMPNELIKEVRKRLGIKKNEIVPGARYHNFNDFFGLPVKSGTGLSYEPLDTLEHKILRRGGSYFDIISEQDQLLHFPYQNYEYVVKLLEEASRDEFVEEINITLYRVAKESRVCKALIACAKNGKKVFVFSEVKARFDEELNMKWGDKMKKSGVQVVYSFDDLKVHSKICLIKRKEGSRNIKYAYFGTGNFNESTAKIYCDHALLTKNESLIIELDKVFEFLKGKIKQPRFKTLLVAPFNMRKRFEEMIDREMDNAKSGRIGKLTIKVNSLEDKKMIAKLYDASNAGVKITIIVRGICCLIPGVEGMSKNIKVISIIDRYLEHGRIYIFHNGGDEQIYLASADWMKRNLSRRVEVGFPILDRERQKEIKKLISLQLKDNVKARRLNKTQSNPYKKSRSKTKVRAQLDFHNYLKKTS